MPFKLLKKQKKSFWIWLIIQHVSMLGVFHGAKEFSLETYHGPLLIGSAFIFLISLSYVLFFLFKARTANKS